MSHSEKIYGLKKKVERLQQENEQLKKELAVLKATVELKGHTDSDKFCIVDDKQYFEMEQNLRHEICEKIREIFDTDINYTFDIETLYDVLDQIEGEK